LLAAADATPFTALLHPGAGLQLLHRLLDTTRGAREVGPGCWGQHEYHWGQKGGVADHAGKCFRGRWGAGSDKVDGAKHEAWCACND